MISFNRLWAVFLRYFYICMSFDTVSDLLYWPAIDIFLWGITSTWIQSQDPNIPHIALSIVTGLIFWHIILKGSNEVGVNILQEFWNRNLLNLFSSPLKLGEWMGAVMLLSLFKSLVGLAFGSFLVFLLYALNIFTLGWSFLFYFASLMISGWFIGFFAGGIAIYTGQRFQMLAWMLAFLFAPFSAVFYPVSALPAWGQVIAKSLPTSYVFEGMRSVLNNHAIGGHYLMMSFLLNGVYLVLAMAFFRFMFEKSRAKGLGRLE